MYEGKTEEKNSFEGQNEGDEIDFDYFKINNWDVILYEDVNYGTLGCI